MLRISKEQGQRIRPARSGSRAVPAEWDTFPNAAKTGKFD